MLPHRFALHRPRSLDDARAAYRACGEDVAYYSGGTELLLALKARVLRYDHLVDLKGLAELARITCADGVLRIGARATHLAIARDPLVRNHLPAYAALSDGIGNIRVRAAGTIGGNLCFAEPHADPPSLLCALEARVVLEGADGTRRVPVADFIEGEFSTVLRDGEVMTAVEVPVPPDGAGFAYLKSGHLERPAAGVAVGVLPGAAGPALRIWVGAIGGRPQRLAELETRLVSAGNAAAGRLAQEAMETLEANDDLHGSADYKRHLAAVLIVRAASAAREAAHGRR